ncbi:hypothetical protein [Helicobacter cappadocius]|uniref:Sulfurtransferase-like selenium metabolism protein YedF n=1 Tax=Helicobacter cappadocius TaxID=3063998 RepID=A0AA90PTV8_9HELI|nr:MULTISPECIES: hypothetical protein [unclassified Helicobacter]MDO7252777.1 hypothetical protein [Helicobacter sp. faydin-H75]MDP2538645.1 hypothetical protein [Helicobacter sp. faydin-H76]
MKNKTILLKSDKIGEGDLGSIVANGFIAITKMPKEILPKKIVFLNRGVLLSTENSIVQNANIISSLKILEGFGVQILSCETCLVHFDLKDKVLVGKISNALDVMKDMLCNEGTISL